MPSIVMVVAASAVVGPASVTAVTAASSIAHILATVVPIHPGTVAAVL
ncbi:hypothetical protein [Kutzneria kofuensis]